MSVLKHNNKSARDFNRAILHWFDNHGRTHLPWQQNRTPYRVWVSEIMLQQTQVSTVIPYYQRFMERFPDVESLAAAEQDDVLHLWTGLGYYARGRNLHACAKEVVKQYNGIFPETVDELSALPGIGRSTAGAVLSLSMNKKATILDGNVKRVLTRFFAVSGWPGTTKVERELWGIAEALTPSERHASYTQAMMDMGATLCTRSKPQCGICPLAPDCEGLKTGQPTQFPNSKPKKTKPTKSAVLLIIKNNNGSVLLHQRQQTGIWGGLWSLPQFDEQCAADQWVKTRFSTQAKFQYIGESFRHTFSHYHLTIEPHYWTLDTNTISELKEHYQESTTTEHWYHIDRPSSIGLPAPVKQLIEQHFHQETLL